MRSNMLYHPTEFFRNEEPSLITKRTPYSIYPHDLRSLLEGLPIEMIEGDDRKKITSLATDSQLVVPGSLFFALHGLRTDGNFYIEEAIDRGAVAIISEQPASNILTKQESSLTFGNLKHCSIGFFNENVGKTNHRQKRKSIKSSSFTYIQVQNIRATLAEMARRFYGNPEQALALTGISGTNGKTTVSYLVKHLLSEPGCPAGMLGTIQYDLGERTLPAYRTTPEAIDIYAMLKQMNESGCRSAVMEVSSHAIEQKRVEGLPFKVACFLNLTRDHLDYHQTMENYFETKARLFTGALGKDPETVIVNNDDSYGQRLRQLIPPGVRVLTFGESQGSDFRAESLQLSTEKTCFTMHTPEDKFSIESQLPGRYNVSNLLASFAILYAHGKDLNKGVKRLADFPGVPGRMERVEAGQAFPVLVDYAHTDNALTNVLNMLRKITPGRILLVFGCGGNRDQKKRPLMTQSAQRGADFCWATADNPRNELLTDIFKDMRQGITDPTRIAFIEDRRRAIHLALSTAQPEDCVLIAGKGHESFQEVDNSVVPFDDRLVARNLLELRRKYQAPSFPSI